MNPENGKLVVGKEDIKSVSLKYCKATLVRNKIVEGYENIIAEKEKRLSKKLNEQDFF